MSRLGPEISLSSPHEDTAESTAEAVTAQQKSSHSLAEVIFVNTRAVDHLAAEEGSICTAANTTFYTWLGTSGKVQSKLRNITEKAT